MTPNELKEKGYQILVENLGEIDAIRFLQQAGWGTDNYTQERQEKQKNITRDEFWQDIERIRARKKLEENF